MAGLGMKVHKDFVSKQALAEGLARAVAQALSRAVTIRGAAVLAVSGGTTPQRFFESLSLQEISWDKIVVTLVDERQVDEKSPRSNARLVKQSLMQNRTKAARFVPMFQNVKKASALDLDVVVLGMGNDGHTASFFPGGDRLKDALDANNREGVIEIIASGAGEPRLTFTRAKLLAAAKRFLHIEGHEKLQVLEKARGGDDVLEMPVRSVLKDVEVYWCP
jgi:6-phosphogluconolactonase